MNIIIILLQLYGKLKVCTCPRRKARAYLKGFKEYLPAKHQYDSLIYMLHPSWVNNMLTFFWKLLNNLFYIFEFSWGPSYTTKLCTLLPGNPDDFLESLCGRSPKGILSLYWIDTCTRSRRSKLSSYLA